MAEVRVLQQVERGSRSGLFHDVEGVLLCCFVCCLFLLFFLICVCLCCCFLFFCFIIIFCFINHRCM